MVATLGAVIATGTARADEPGLPSVPAVATSFAAGAPAGFDRVPTLPGRPLGSRVGESSALAESQRRLDALNATGPDGCVVAYQRHKAQAWLNFARYAEQSAVPAAVGAAALRHAGDVMTEVENRKSPSMATLELPGSRHERDDLWRMVEAVKSDGRLCGAPRMTAYCEVQLAWAGYEASVGGWRHVDPYLRIAEDYCVTARDAVAVPQPEGVAVHDSATMSDDAAGGSVEAAPVEMPSVQITPPGIPPLQIPAVRIPSPEWVPVGDHVDAAVRVLFPHNRSRRKDIRAPGRAELAHLAAYLKTLPTGTLITATGHADITGSPRHNQALSARRARSVARELEMLGVDPARIRLHAVGSAEPSVTCDRPRTAGGRSRYLACLERDRLVDVRVIGEGENWVERRSSRRGGAEDGAEGRVAFLGEARGLQGPPVVNGRVRRRARFARRGFSRCSWDPCGTNPDR
jgi:outer membrane protein OmpA-like peptidoglycan-associated protein